MLTNTDHLPRTRHVKKKKLEAEAESFSPGQSYFVAHVTESNLRVDTLFLPRWFARSDVLNQGSNTISIINEGVMRTWTLGLNFRQSSRTFYMRSGWSSFCYENGLEPGDFITFKLECSNRKPPLLRFSTADLKKSSQSASSSLNEDRVMKRIATPASLKYGRISLPRSLTRIFISENKGGKKITMLDKHGVEWPVHLLMEKRSGKMSLGSGLKEFFKANDIKAYKSFVLELVWKDICIPMLKFCPKKI